MRRVLETGVFAVALTVFFSTVALATPDLYIKDTPADTGVEPNPDPGPMWISEDIWVRRTPDPNYRPFPFLEASPPWIPAPHQNPEYHDPKYGIPNYVYVRVRNRGTTPSSGTEQLQLYWAKASTGLSWPASWVDSLALVCGTNRLLGAEITKPRKNAASASLAEQQALRDALVQAATNPAFTFLAGHSYWTKQQHVHGFSPEHGNPAFLPWHREFLNHFELLLQEADPRVKLMYWNWTTDPTSSTGTNLYTSAFMGNSGRGTGGVGMGAPLAPALNPHPSDTSAAVVRDLSSGLPTAEADLTVLGRADYFNSTTPNDNFSVRIESVPNHNSVHGYIGGNGDMSFVSRSARDPFFFLLHSKVDELWARWQRANVSRLDSATAYGSASGSPVLTSPQHPWDGVPNTGAPIDPWTVGGGYIVSKTSFERSVVSPPIYDTAPLTIPALAPGEAVVLEIPWYPSDPAHYACLGDMAHFCLLSRITPGITTAEGTDISTNVRNNNNLAWKNIQVIDDFPGAIAALSLIIKNDTDRPMVAGLMFREATDRFVRLSEQVAAVHIGLAPELHRRWVEGGSRQQNLKPTELDLKRSQGVNAEIAKSRFLTMGGTVGMIENIQLRPFESLPVHLIFQLKPDYAPSNDTMVFDVVQRQSVGDRTEVVGGVQYRIDLSKILLVKERSGWRHMASGSAPPSDWNGTNFDDSKWQLGPAPFGFGQNVEATVGVPPNTTLGTAYFRKQFQVQDPRFLRSLTLRARYDDGIAVYLNGREVYRGNLPDGSLTPGTLAIKEISGAAERAFFPVQLKPEMLREGENVLAVECTSTSNTTAT